MPTPFHTTFPRLTDASALHCSISRWTRRVVLSLCVTSLTTACASLPAPVPRPDAHALAQADYQATDLGRLTASSAPGANVSGFRLLASGEDALGSLVALADNAKRTLDLQYYLIHSDGSSRS